MANLKAKDFIFDVIEQLKANPRRVLAGHGIPSVIIRELQEREDVLSKLANFLLTTKLANRGANGLKKSSKFQIFGYKNASQFLKASEADLNSFFGDDEVGGDADSQAVLRASNCAVIMFTPQNSQELRTKMTDEEGNEGWFVRTKIVAGSSSYTTYAKAAAGEAKIAGTKYLVLAWEDSILRPADNKVAFTRSKRNERIVARELKPAKVRAALKRDLKAAIERNERTLNSLRAKKSRYQEAIAEINSNAELNAYIESLSGVDRNIYDRALAKLNAGNTREAKMLAATAEDPETMWNAIQFSAGSDETNKVRSALRSKLNKLNKELAEWLDTVQQLQDAGRPVADNITKRVNALQRQINAITVKLKNSDKRLKKNHGTAAANVNYQQLLAQVNKRIARNEQKGMRLSKALENAVASLGVDAETVQEVKSDVLAQVAAGIEQETAIEQAIQQQAANIQQQQAIIDEDLDDEDYEDADVATDGVIDLDTLFSSIS